MRTVDDPESPDFSPDGRRVAFAALRQGVGDIFVLDLDTGDVTNVTDDAFADSGQTWSPDGQSIVYVGRVSGNEKLFRLDLATGAKTQASVKSFRRCSRNSRPAQPISSGMWPSFWNCLSVRA
jgi:Tol biopolymer transport system component